jgi:hypothetical protein
MGLRPAIVFLTLVFAQGCAADRLSHDDARRKIADIGRSNLVPDAIEIRRIVSQTDTQAIAEAGVTLAFQFKRDNPEAEWRIAAVRLGDRDWVSLDELFAAINDGRRRATLVSLQNVADGIAKYEAATGALPSARDIVGLTDILHPRYVSQLVREDGWGYPLEYEVTGASTYHLMSVGPDGRRGTADDVVLESSRAASP